jgi:hypothetical protein
MVSDETITTVDVMVSDIKHNGPVAHLPVQITDIYRVQVNDLYILETCNKITSLLTIIKLFSFSDALPKKAS